METQPIEKYIEFARDNGFIFKDGDSQYGNACYFYIEDNSIVLNADIGKHGTNEILNELNLIETITSKEFIEAIARGLKDGVNFQNPYCRDIDKITTQQAIHIMENTLDEFIEQILPKQ